MRRLLTTIALASALLACGCATRQVQTLASLPLPADSAAHCCWQALQQLDINYDGQRYQLTGALAQTRAGVTLVLLDPLGRRLLSVSKRGDQIDTYRSPELPEGLPERFLLASSMLVWWPLVDWQEVLSEPWQITADNAGRILSYRGKALLSASYVPSSAAIVEGMSSASLQQPVLLKHQHQPLTIGVTTTNLERVP